MTVLVGLAYVLAALLCLAVVLPLSFVGLAPSDADRLLWPWPSDDGIWALAANVACLALWCSALAWSARRCVRDWTDDHDLRLWPIGLAGALATEPSSATAVTGLAAFALVVVVARQVALTPRPAPRWRPSRVQRVAVIVACVALAVAALSYQALHPLSASFENRGSPAGMSIWSSNGDRSLHFQLGNDGTSALTVRGIDVADVAARSATVEVRGMVDTAAGSLVGQRIARGQTFRGDVTLTQSGCRDARTNGHATIYGLDVRYETLGMTRTQWLPVDPPARLRCDTR